MIISLIAALSNDGVIGNRGKIPWHLPADLKHFKEITLGHPVIMGRKTYESIGKPLPGRTNIIVTRHKEYAAPECVVASTLEEAFDAARVSGAGEAFVIGGAEIYKEAMPRAEKLYLTNVEGDFEGDAFFPEVSSLEWKEISREKGVVDEKNGYPHTFLVFERKRN